MSARDGEPSLAELLPLMRAVGYLTDWIPADRRLTPGEACALAGSSFRDLGRRIKRGWRFVGDHAGGGDTAPLLHRLLEVETMAGLVLGLARLARSAATGGVAVDSTCAADRVAELESELREADEQLDTMHDRIEASLAALRSGARPTFEDTLSQLRDIARVYEDAPLALAVLHLDAEGSPEDVADRAGDVLVLLLARATLVAARLADSSRERLPSRARGLGRLLAAAAGVTGLLEALAAAPAVNPETKGDLG